VLEAGTDAGYLMLTMLGGLTEFERWTRAAEFRGVLGLDREGRR
jgi:hypothetical protein